MPNRDGTGPQGKSPMGKQQGRGVCNGSGSRSASGRRGCLRTQQGPPGRGRRGGSDNFGNSRENS